MGGTGAAMFGLYERMVAFRYLRARRSEGFISVIAWFSLIGIALGVATLIVVMSVMNGFRAELVGKLLGLNGHITVASMAGPLEDYDTLAETVDQVPGVTFTMPTVEGQAMAMVNNRATGVLVRGIRPADFAVRPILNDSLTGGSLADFQPNTVIIGYRLAQRLGLRVGDTITLVSPFFNSTGFGRVPRLKDYLIAGVFDVGMYQYDDNFAFMTLPDAQVFFKTEQGVSYLEVFTEDPDNVEAMRAAVIRALPQQYLIGDWLRAQGAFVGALQVERNVMFLILTLIILVAAFNIISSLIMLVKDKQRAIAIMRTMGASRGMIMRIFFMTGASIGVIGTLLGFALGLVICDNIEEIKSFLETSFGAELFPGEIYYLSRLPAKVDPAEVVQVLAMALGLSFLATIYPSWRAARLDPVVALREE
ncbi:MAG: lipoprotein-releasing ABC transporter permease subunit [Alphaproteobacteria bacterium]